jgi:uncharacterized protein GlcG (DUF336 family)
MTTMLSLEQAMTIARGALDRARADRLKPMCVVVLDSAGHRKVSLCEDGGNPFGIAIAEAKATTAHAFKNATQTLADVFANNPGGVAALSHICDGRFAPLGGGLPIYDADGQLVGAAAASGDMPDRDAAIIRGAIEAVGLMSVARPAA